MHPLSHTYLGQSFDFEEMAHGKHSMTNDALDGDGGLRTVFLDTYQDDRIYFDPAWDADFSAWLNEDAKRELEGEDRASSRAQMRKVKEVARAMAAFIDLRETETDSSMGLCLSRPIYVYVSHQGSAEQKTITRSVLGL